MVGYLWPVARKARADPPLASSARCPWGCAEEGMARHLAWRCPALDGPRRFLAGESETFRFRLFLEAEAGTPGGAEEHHAWSKRLLPDQREDAPLPFHALLVHRAGSRPGIVLAREAFLDGSACRATDRRLARAGLAAVAAWADGPERTAS